jgi:hypothetical protein
VWHRVPWRHQGNSTLKANYNGQEQGFEFARAAEVNIVDTAGESMG